MLLGMLLDIKRSRHVSVYLLQGYGMYNGMMAHMCERLFKRGGVKE